MVKVHKLVAAIASAITLSTTSAYALELGDISWQSSYGQPLRAKIALKDTNNIKATDINPTLSKNSSIDGLLTLTFRPVILGDGSGYIEVKSTAPINEPFLTFGVNLAYNGQSLTKEYNVLLDMPANTDKAVSNTKAKQPSTSQASTKTNAGTSYRTSRGETLWSIAQKSYNTNVTAKAAKAIYDKNPKAFIKGQHTQIIAGYNLKLPTLQEVNTISTADANAFISGKAATPKTVNNTANTKDTKAIQSKLQESEQALAEARDENEKLSLQLDNLQSEIDRLQALSKEKDTQITEIQTKLTQPTDQQSTPTSTPEAAPSQTNETPTAVAASPKQETPVVDSKEKATTHTAVTNTAPVADKKPEVAPPKTTQPKPTPSTTPTKEQTHIDDGPSFLSSLLGNQTMMMAGGGVLVLLGLLALLIRRKKAMNDDAEEVDLSNISLDDDTDNLEDQQADTENTTEDPISKLGEGMSVLDKVDIYLLYHHVDQAKALLKTALEEEPTNAEYYLKLLEILAENGEQEAFDKESEHFLLIEPMAQHKIDAIKLKYNTGSSVSTPSPTLTEQDTASYTTPIESPLSQDTSSSEDDHISATPNFSFTQEEPEGQGLQKNDKAFSFDEPSLNDTKTDEKSIDDDTHAFFSTNPIEDDYSSFNIDPIEIAEPELKKQDEPVQDFDFDIEPIQTKTEETSIEAPALEIPTTTVEEEYDEILEKDQVTTKLELVQAYINMGDDEGAKDLLQEIIKEGNETQKTEAEKLLASLASNNATSEPSIELVADNDDTTLTELDLGFSLPPEDEVVTKLELARAYIDMGDKTGAKEILEEVLSEGSEAQKQRATELINSLNE